MAQEDLRRILSTLLRRRTKRVITSRVKGGRRTDIITVGKQGRYIKYRDPKGAEVRDIALLPTIKSAILHATGGKVDVKRRDYKEKVRRRKISTLICLVLDTSSSMVSYHKMLAVQSALDALMMDAYQSRDRIAVVTCYGRTAEIVIPFTSSVEKAKQSVERAPYGGTTPLARGLRKGMETLRAKLRVEPDTTGLLVLATDGWANTPIVPGEDVLHEIYDTCSVIRDSGIPLIVIDVNPEGSDIARLIAREAGGVHYLALPPKERIERIDVARMYKTDRVIDGLAAVIANPNLRGLMIRGASRDIVKNALKMLDDISMELRAAGRCVLGCAPDEPAHFCYACRLRYEEGQEVPGALWSFPIVSAAEPGIEDLRGGIYVRFLPRKGLLARAHRGILYLEGGVDKETAAFLAQSLTTGSYTLREKGFELSLPARTTALLSTEEKDAPIPQALAPCIDLVVDVPEITEMTDRIANTIYLRQFEIDPMRFETRIERERREKIQTMLKARKILKEVRFERYDMEILWQIATLFSDAPEFLERLVSTARLMAAKRLSPQVSEMEIAHALLELQPFWTKDGKIPPAMGPFVQVAEGVAASETIVEKLLAGFVSPHEVKGILLHGFEDEAVKNALKYIQESGLEVEMAAGCRYGCDPGNPAELCPSCSLKHELGSLRAVKAPIPLVSLSTAHATRRIKGGIYIRYLVTPNPLTRAHRGVIFIEGIEELGTEAAEVIAEVMASGYNQVERGKVIHRLPARFLLVGTVRDKEAEIHPMLMKHIPLFIEASPLDEVRRKVRTVMLMRLFSESPERFASDVRIERERIYQHIVQARERYPTVQITDSQLDAIARVCADLGAEGNMVEFLVGIVARIYAALRGESRVADEDIIRAIAGVLPMRLTADVALHEGAVERGQVIHSAVE
ncbi:MAG: VWA domain-containing protein [Candidatus Thermoplasmatota archaeon]